MSFPRAPRFVEKENDILASPADFNLAEASSANSCGCRKRSSLQTPSSRSVSPKQFSLRRSPLVESILLDLDFSDEGIEEDLWFDYYDMKYLSKSSTPFKKCIKGKDITKVRHSQNSARRKSAKTLGEHAKSDPDDIAKRCILDSVKLRNKRKPLNPTVTDNRHSCRENSSRNANLKRAPQKMAHLKSNGKISSCKIGDVCKPIKFSKIPISKIKNERLDVTRILNDLNRTYDRYKFLHNLEDTIKEDTCSIGQGAPLNIKTAACNKRQSRVLPKHIDKLYRPDKENKLITNDCYYGKTYVKDKQQKSCRLDNTSEKEYPCIMRTTDKCCHISCKTFQHAPNLDSIVDGRVNGFKDKTKDCVCDTLYKHNLLAINQTVAHLYLEDLEERVNVLFANKLKILSNELNDFGKAFSCTSRKTSEAENDGLRKSRTVSDKNKVVLETKLSKEDSVIDFDVDKMWDYYEFYEYFRNDSEVDALYRFGRQ